MEPQQIFHSVVLNISLMLSAAFIFGILMQRYSRGFLKNKLPLGILFGLLSLFCMTYPIQISPGIIFDLRVVVVGVAGLFGGLTTAIISTVFPIAYRFYLGGAGQYIGVAAIITSAIAGGFLHFLLPSQNEIRPIWHYGLCGIFTTVIGLSLSLALPPQYNPIEMFFHLLPIVIFLYPIGAVIFGFLFNREIQNINIRESIKTNESRYHSLFENSPISLWEVDYSELKFYLHQKFDNSSIKEIGKQIECDETVVLECASRIKITDVNKKSLLLFQSQSREQMEKNLPKIFPKESLETFKRILTAIYWGKHSIREELEVESLTGRTHSIILDWFVPDNHRRDYSRVILSMQDITDQKTALDALKIKNEQFDDISKSIPGIVYQFMATPEKKYAILYLSDGAEEIFERPMNELLDPELLLSGIYNEDTTKFFQSIEQSYITLKDWSLVFRVRLGTGEIKWMQGKSRPRRLANGNTIWNGVLFDITEIINIQNQLQHSQKMQAVGQLAGGIAHDFNNILSGITGYTELAMNKVAPDNKEIRNYLENIFKASSRAKHLVSQILTFSRKREYKLSPIHLEPTVYEAIELIRPSLPPDIPLNTNIQRDTLAVMGDSTKIHEALLNLATNAIQAMKEKGELHISLTERKIESIEGGVLGHIKAGFYSIIEVRDTGPGIEEQQIAKLFEPFYTSKENQNGTGLGLSVVYAVMQLHQGNINVVSQPGTGTLIQLFFPKTSHPVDNLSSSPEKPRGGREKILLVDDDKTVIDVYTQLLSSLGYEMTSTCSSSHAFELFKSSPAYFDLLITDQTMPQMDGMELSRQVLQLKPDLPVILHTGYSSEITEKKVADSGIKFLVYKPVSVDDLAIKIREALEESKS